jgi:ribosomal protein S18 acetylase RimI-like enzyme
MCHGRGLRTGGWLQTRRGQAEVIRALEHADGDGCLEVIRSLPEWFSYPGAIESITDALGRQSGYVAQAGEMIAGFVLLDPIFEETLEITYLAVHASQRRSGFGRRLVAAAASHAERIGASQICLLTLGPSAGSPFYEESVAFYRSIGFDRTKEVELSSWSGAPALVMSSPVSRLGLSS